VGQLSELVQKQTAWCWTARAGSAAALRGWVLFRGLPDALSRNLGEERERWFLWVPVFLSLGIAAYFALPFEPWLPGSLVLVLLLGGGLFLLRLRPVLALVTASLFCMASGFAAVSLRSALVEGPVLARAWDGEITGRVISNVRTEAGQSLLIAPLSMSRLGPAEMPQQIRFAIRIKGAVASPGEIVRMRGHLEPPPEPVEPGGFDYARAVWFQGLGGTGFAYTAPELISGPQGSTAWIERLRAAITLRIHDGIGGTSGAIAAALVTGDQRAIPEEAMVDLRNAGLAHVLSISGLHMVLFGGSLFCLVRASLSLIPGIALNYPIKKWGAVAALMGASFYLLISGAEVAAQRAYIMLALMFIAVLFDRPAISLRNVALAAIIVLLWRPESLIGASFQMSFAAVIALVSFYESTVAQRLSVRLHGIHGWRAAPVWLAAYLVGIIVTSLIAGAATGPFAAYHFNRIAVYGLLGNISALPIVGFIVMPAALLTLVLMPLGLEAYALWAMGKGIDIMLSVSHWVATLPGAVAIAPTAPFYALMLFLTGGLWLSLWQRRWRFLGLAPILLGLSLWGSSDRADVYIDRDGALSAVRMSNGLLALSDKYPGYTAEMWLLHDGDMRTAEEAAASPVMHCEKESCIYHEEGRPLIAFPQTLAGLAEDCRRAEIIVATMPLPRRVEA
jgi:competence protein ComEC